MVERDRAVRRSMRARDRPLRRLRPAPASCRARRGGGARSSARYESAASRRNSADAARSIHRQVPGGRRRRAAAGGERAATPRSPPRTCCWRCSSRTTASSSRSCRSSAPTPPAIAPQRERRASTSCRRSAATVEPTPASPRRFVKVLQRAEKETAALGDEYISTEHLLLALADESRGVADLLPDRDSLDEAIERGARPAPGHLARTPRTRCRRWRSSAAT